MSRIHNLSSIKYMDNCILLCNAMSNIFSLFSLVKHLKQVNEQKSHTYIYIYIIQIVSTNDKSLYINTEYLSYRNNKHQRFSLRAQSKENMQKRLHRGRIGCVLS